MSVSGQERKPTPRNIAGDLKRFLTSVENSTAANIVTLSDCGYLLLILKDQVIQDGAKSGQFTREFVARPISGLDILSKLVMTLQAIINTPSEATSKFSNFLTAGSNNTNKKRKAAVAEADCIEVIKLLLEKSDQGWTIFLESATGMDAILHSVYSPQLDSKCFALEILLLLLGQPQGFVVLMRALTASAARTREYQRLLIFISQLKHGIHTHKLHIQILVVRLLNKLLLTAPSPIHQNLIRTEAAVAQFNPDTLEMMIATRKSSLDGVSVLLDEIAFWKSLTPSHIDYPLEKYKTIVSEPEIDTMTEQKRFRMPMGKYTTGSATMSKNLERQRMKRQSERGSIGREPSVNYYASHGSSMHIAPSRSSQTLSARAWENQTISNSSKPSSKAYNAQNESGWGLMRRAKSESSMLVEDRDEIAEIPKGLKRYDSKKPSNVVYHPIQRSGMSKSVHDLSRRIDDYTSQGTSSRPSSALTMKPLSLSRAMSPNIKIEEKFYSPRERPTSSQARFADPPVKESQPPHGGFSYLFPQQPIVSCVVSKRQNSINDNNRLYASTMSPPLRAASQNEINFINTQEFVGASESQNSSRQPLYHAVEKTVIGEDVLDALSKFDYLNDYDQINRNREYSLQFQRL